ncbi:MAG: single-stranded-DNA-specific exonuclease RecJ [Patescibacteria group bacterium]|nr:single-stranded-DNA-specific exonuclease RecJ [Patescibacteria group bacterium]
MKKKWKILDKAPNKFFSQFPEIDPIVLQLLYNRELKTQKDIDGFLNLDYGEDQHDPFLFKDMKKASKRIFKALEKKEKVAIYGDYDADGVTSTAIIYNVLTELGFKNIEVYIPYRMTEGYGINEKAVKEFVDKNIDLMITVDCGIANKEEIALANKKGIDVIITDHHHEPLNPPDKAFAIINPKVKEEKYPFKDLAGVGVAFKLAQALIKESRKKGLDIPRGYEKWLLDLVAIGTVTDCVGLIGENRTLVRYGLVVLNKTKKIGLRKLIKKSRLNLGELEAWNIAFQLGPRLNAAGRLDHASTSFKLLITGDNQEAEEIVEGLEKTNKERQKITEKMVGEAKEQIDEKKAKGSIISVLGQDWSAGLIGLVAGRLCDQFYRPIIVLSQSENEVIASGRSIPEFDIIEAVEKLRKHLKDYGGHAAACGFTLKARDRLDEFNKELLILGEERLKDLDLFPKIVIEKKVKLEEITHDLLHELEEFKPFGQGNKKPLFLLENLTVVNFDLVGKNTNHLRLMVKQDDHTVRKCIGFYQQELAKNLKNGQKIDLVCEVSFNEWNGTKEIQLKIIDLKIKK